MIDSGKGGKERQTRARILLKADAGEHGENWKVLILQMHFILAEHSGAHQEIIG